MQEGLNIGFTMIDTNKLQYGSMLGGFSNNEPDILFSTTFTGGSMSPGQYSGPHRASAPMDNASNISQIIVRFTGIESHYRLVNGYLQVEYPTQDIIDYAIVAMTYFSGGNVVVDFYIVAHWTVNVPAITFSCIASTFLPPF